MKATIQTLIAMVLVVSSTSYADLTCVANNVGLGDEQLTLVINEKTRVATVTIGSEKQDLALDHSVWDGHSAGLMTGKGIAFLYNNWYGCIRNAELTTDIRFNGPAGSFSKVAFSYCNGGSTPDSICNPNVK